MGTEAERTGGRDEEAVARFVERFAAMLADAGMTRMPARVFAAILASDDGAATAAELSERLTASPAAISGAVRYLIHIELIRRTREPGSRRDTFRLYENTWHELMRRRYAVLEAWASTMREGAEALNLGSSAGARVMESAEFFQYLADEVPNLMDDWHRRREERLPVGRDRRDE